MAIVQRREDLDPSVSCEPANEKKGHTHGSVLVAVRRVSVIRREHLPVEVDALHPLRA